MTKPVPVAVFVDRYAPGGTQRQMLELITRLDRRRFRVHPVCFHTEGAWFDRLASLGDPVAVFPIHGFRRPATTRQLFAFARWCRDHEIAVLHTCELYSNIFGLPGGALAAVPVRIGSRRGFVETRGLQHLQKTAYTAAHRVVANSHAAADRLRVEGVPESKIRVIPNGIDPSAFAGRRYTGAARRVGVIACLREEKRIDVLIAAAPKILAASPDAEFVVTGDGTCRDLLIALARENGVLPRFRFLGHRDDVVQVLSELDVFVLPSRSEAFPNSIIEAMASGLPVVASAVGGIPELVSDGTTGHLVQAGNVDALADAVIGLLRDPARAEAFGRAGQRAIEATYSFDRMVGEFEELYRSELHARRAQAVLPGSRVKRAVKGTLMRTFLASGLPTARDRINVRLGRGKLTVLAYHQVKEPANDNSTVSPAAFRAQMEFVRRHHRVVSLSEGVAAVTSGRTTERLVAITFDDGYKDNATIAAPILRELGLPACFFVSTEMIGSERPFPHDIEQGRPRQAHMSWADLRTLAADGFEIGSHSATHADFGRIPLAEAEWELRSSRERLMRELGRDIQAFAFPYGHRRNMRADTVAAARREYAICCSAHGGHNVTPSEPGNIRRIVISTGVTPLAFEAILEGWPILRFDNPYHSDVDATAEPLTP
jgi:L-malate glycosyltransferase